MKSYHALCVGSLLTITFRTQKLILKSNESKDWNRPFSFYRAIQSSIISCILESQESLLLAWPNASVKPAGPFSTRVSVMKKTRMSQDRSIYAELFRHSHTLLGQTLHSLWGRMHKIYLVSRTVLDDQSMAMNIILIIAGFVMTFSVCCRSGLSYTAKQQGRQRVVTEQSLTDELDPKAPVPILKANQRRAANSHGDSVTALSQLHVFSERMLLSGSADGCIKVWKWFTRIQNLSQAMFGSKLT